MKLVVGFGVSGGCTVWCKLGPVGAREVVDMMGRGLWRVW